MPGKSDDNESDSSDELGCVHARLDRHRASIGRLQRKLAKVEDALSRHDVPLSSSEDEDDSEDGDEDEEEDASLSEATGHRAVSSSPAAGLLGTAINSMAVAKSFDG